MKWGPLGSNQRFLFFRQTLYHVCHISGRKNEFLACRKAKTDLNRSYCFEDNRSTNELRVSFTVARKIRIGVSISLWCRLGGPAVCKRVS